MLQVGRPVTGGRPGDIDGSDPTRVQPEGNPMAQFILEYTDNIKSDADIPGLLRKINDTIIAQTTWTDSGGGMQSRAIELKDYRMADGAEDYAFVHATLKLGAGWSDRQKKKLCDGLFRVMKLHFAPLFESRYLALSMELYEFPEGTYQHYDVQARVSAQIVES